MHGSTVVKQYDFNEPNVHEVEYLLDDIFIDCRNKYFHTFEYTLVYDIEFTNISNNEEINVTITHRSMEFKTEFYGLNKKIKIARRNGFVFNQKSKITIKIYSILSNINLRYYLKLPVPMMHRKFFKILFQNGEYVKAHCNVVYNLFQFPYRKWYLDNQSS